MTQSIVCGVFIVSILLLICLFFGRYSESFDYLTLNSARKSLENPARINAENWRRNVACGGLNCPELANLTARPFYEAVRGDIRAIPVRAQKYSPNSCDIAFNLYSRQTGAKIGQDSRKFHFRQNPKTCEWKVISMGPKNSGNLV